MAVTAQGSGTQTTSVTARSVSDGVTNTTTTITSATAAFVSGDVGRLVTGSADLPSGVYIASVTNGTTAVLSAAATASHTGQTFALGTEFVILDVAVAGAFQLELDKTNLAAGDVLEIRIYNIVLTGGSRRVMYFQSFAGAQPTDDMCAVSVPASNDLTDSGSLRFTLKQTFGIARAFDWKVLKFA